MSAVVGSLVSMKLQSVQIKFVVVPDITTKIIGIKKCQILAAKLLLLPMPLHMKFSS
jgi:hypothetical protein